MDSKTIINSFESKKLSKNIVTYAALIIFAILILLPLYWILVSSFKTEAEIGLTPPTLFPTTFTFNAYSEVWASLEFPRSFLNTMIASVVTTVLIVLFSAMAGYVLAKKNLIIGKPFFMVLIATMIVPPTVLLIPLYFIIDSMQMADSLLGIILPFSVTSFGIVFMTTYVKDVPTDIIEAATIDGANTYITFFIIVLPLLIPGLATLATISFVNNYNSFTVPLVVLKDPANFTIPLKLESVINSNENLNWAMRFAATTISTFPVVVLFLAVQKWFVGGLVSGAVKG